MNGSWRDEYVLNIEHLDERHWRFFSICDELGEYFEQWDDSSRLLRLMKYVIELRRFVLSHYSIEESAILSVNMERYFDHSRKHDEFLEQLSRHKNSIQELYYAVVNGNNGREALVDQVRQMHSDCLSWWGRHIMEVDVKDLRVFQCAPGEQAKSG